MDSADTATTPVDQPPLTDELNYKTVVTRIIQVANQHKSRLAITALVGAAPILLAMILMTVVIVISTISSVSLGVIILLALMILMFIITPFWMVLVNRINRVEQILWVKASFDNDTEAGGQSLKKALRMMGPSARLSFGMFQRYYWPFWTIVTLYIAALVLTIVYLFSQSNTPEAVVMLMVLVVFASPITIIIIYYFVAQAVSLKTRYVPIIFVNNYGKPGFSYSWVFEENRRLVELDAQNEQSFGNKLLLLAAGADASATAALGAATVPVSAAASATVGAVSRSRNAAQATYALTMLYGSEAAALSETLAQTVVFYMAYLSVTDGSTRSVKQ